MDEATKNSLLSLATSVQEWEWDHFLDWISDTPADDAYAYSRCGRDGFEAFERRWSVIRNLLPNNGWKHEDHFQETDALARLTHHEYGKALVLEDYLKGVEMTEPATAEERLEILRGTDLGVVQDILTKVLEYDLDEVMEAPKLAQEASECIVGLRAILTHKNNEIERLRHERREYIPEEAAKEFETVLADLNEARAAQQAAEEKMNQALKDYRYYWEAINNHREFVQSDDINIVLTETCECDGTGAYICPTCRLEALRNELRCILDRKPPEDEDAKDTADAADDAAAPVAQAG